DDFFFERRILPQLDEAVKNGKLLPALKEKANNIRKKFPGIIPASLPSLLHGDLWNGNFLTAGSGNACMVDPAVYYGHPEMDLAMTKLFGGFDNAFYEAYREASSQPPGFEMRCDIHNLYPLLVHVNLFGGGYAAQVKSILERF